MRLTNLEGARVARSPRLDLFLVASLTLFLASTGGHPFYHPDSIVVRSLHVLGNGGSPDFFRYPGLIIYADALLYGLVFLVFYATRTVSGFDDFADQVLAGMLPGGIPSHLPALLLTYAFSVLAVVVTYSLTYRMLRDRIFAALAALFVATSPLWTANSHFATVDVPMAALVLCTVYFVHTLAVKGAPLQRSQSLLLGVWIGLSVSAKYTAILVAVPAVAVTSACFVDRSAWTSHLKWMASAAALTFLVTNPFSVPQAGQFLYESFDEAAHGMRGDFGWQHREGPLFHIHHTLKYAFGTPILALAIVGAVAFIRNRSVSSAQKRALTLFPAAYYLVVGNSQLAFQRYMIPMAPFLGFFAAWGAHEIFRVLQPRVRKQRVLRIAVPLVALTLALPNLLTSVRHNRTLMAGDTRESLRALIDVESIADETRVSGGHYVATVLPGIVDENWDSLDPKPPDLLILDSFTHDRYLYDPRKGRRFQLVKKTFANGSVIQISPFRVLKIQAPFSPQSVYSPYLPDLPFRRRSGPFIELYVPERALADSLERRASELGIEHSFLPAVGGYYFQNFSDHGPTRGVD